MTGITRDLGSAPVHEERPPGPRGRKLVRALLDYRRNALATLESLSREYGDVTYFPLPGGGAFLLNHPDLIHHVLIRNVDNYGKTNGSKWARRFFGNAMQLNNGDYARQMRRIVAPAFHGEGLLNAYGNLILRETSALVDSWEPGERPGLTAELNDLVLDIVVQIFFGTAPGADTRRAGALFLAALTPAGAVLPAWMPGSRNQQYVRGVAALNAFVMQRIADARTSGSSGSDFISVLVRLGGKDGHGLSDQQIRDEIVAYALAGYSTGTALNQVLRLVAENPEADEGLEAEVARVTGDRAPGLQDLSSLNYLGKVLKESLRLCPPAGMMFRRAFADDVIDGWRIPKGARMFLSSWVVQRDRRFFDDPLAFKPERWTPEFERALPPCAYFPFGRGPRACIGGAMGEMILQLIVATIAKRYRLVASHKFPDDQAEWPAVMAAGGLRARLFRRTT
jgi:cytochrome P450